MTTTHPAASPVDPLDIGFTRYSPQPPFDVTAAILTWPRHTGPVGPGPLTATQPALDPNRIAELADWADPDDDEPILIAHHDGIRYVLDGHHRLAAPSTGAWLTRTDLPAEHLTNP